MPSKTEIANMALHRVGAQRIMDLNDQDSKSARVVRDFFEPAICEVGRLAEWQCLKDRATLGQLATAPAFGWTYAYQLPATFLRLVKLNGVDYRGQPGDDHEIEGMTLLTDATEAKIEFIAYKEDTAGYDSLFVKAVVAKLAAEIAVPIRQDEGLAARLMEEFERLALPKGRLKTAGERRLMRFDPAAESSFVNSRFNSTNG
jgi:hypothetical protein